MLLAKLPQRTSDDFGEGFYHASRGERLHNGIDLCAYPGTSIFAISPGTVTKINWVYTGDFHYRYVEVTIGGGHRQRYFYVTPTVIVGDRVTSHTVLGTVQDIAKKYTDLKKRKVMINHVHFEVRDLVNTAVDPNKYL
jgi:murein DD-endopeptidase MepM/ murein hydrolase activator NlpD